MEKDDTDEDLDIEIHSKEWVLWNDQLKQTEKIIEALEKDLTVSKALKKLYQQKVRELDEE